MAQLGARLNGIEEVEGSNPSRSTKLLSLPTALTLWPDHLSGAMPMQFIDERNIGWTAWSFSKFPPALLEGHDYTPTVAGTFFRERMLGGR